MITITQQVTPTIMVQRKEPVDDSKDSMDEKVNNQISGTATLFSKYFKNSLLIAKLQSAQKAQHEDGHYDEGHHDNGHYEGPS